MFARAFCRHAFNVNVALSAALSLLQGERIEVRSFATLAQKRACRALNTHFCPDASAAGFRLRDVPLDGVEINAINAANQTARAIINVNLRNGANIELLRHGCSPPDDVDLAQRYLRICLRHLLQAR